VIGILPDPRLKLAGIGGVELAAAVDKALPDMGDLGNVERDRDGVSVWKDQVERLALVGPQQVFECR
jgi:hypothetical protein